MIPDVRSSPAFRLAQATVVVAAVAFLLAVVVAGGDDGAGEPGRAGFDLVPFQPGGPAGVVHLERRGPRLLGTVAVWGLAPGTRHYAALRGPGARCGGPLAQVAAALPRLTADENGVAAARVDVPRPQDAFEAGVAVTVHTGPDPGSSAVACGVARGGPRLTPAILSALGGRDAGAPGADVSALLQLEGGRPVGRDGPLLIRARRGDSVALGLRADEPDELRIEGYGLVVQVGPGTIARLAFRAGRPGRHAITGRTTGARPAAELVVEP